MALQYIRECLNNKLHSLSLREVANRDQHYSVLRLLVKRNVPKFVGINARRYHLDLPFVEPFSNEESLGMGCKGNNLVRPPQSQHAQVPRCLLYTSDAADDLLC